MVAGIEEELEAATGGVGGVATVEEIGQVGLGGGVSGEVGVCSMRRTQGTADTLQCRKAGYICWTSRQSDNFLLRPEAPKAYADPDDV
jgi:hypothetical protein